MFCCELLSKVLFLRWFTTGNLGVVQLLMLWIAFKSSIFTMIYNSISFTSVNYPVVNCFQKFYFYDDLQRLFAENFKDFCCELLSKVLFLRWFTTLSILGLSDFVLWIAFKSSIFTMIYNFFIWASKPLFVVNCFQKFYFYDDLQRVDDSSAVLNSCELLSKVLFLRWFTTGDLSLLHSR